MLDTRLENELSEICDNSGAELLLNTKIAPYTTFKIGGRCNIIKINSTKFLITILKWAKENSVPFRILGRGSNVLISDNGQSGIVIVITKDSFGKIDVEGETITCQSGAGVSEVCRAAALHSLSGMEFAYGIPGTIGGGVCMNAGAYGGEMSQIISACECVDPYCDAPVPFTIENNEMELSYRNSVFLKNGFIVTKASFKLKRGDRTLIKQKMDELTAARREKQPLEFPSGGSTFKRPKDNFAAKLIDDCGLKGVKIGGAEVSEKHAGFIINKGGATFSDVKSLIQLVKNTVFEKTGITLETEICIWE